MIKIVNSTPNPIILQHDDNTLIVQSDAIIELNQIHYLSISHNQVSYYNCIQEKNGLLKVMRFLDDPFNVRKEYHLFIESQFDALDLSNDITFEIVSKMYCADTDIPTYYHYLDLIGTSQSVIPSNVRITQKEKIVNIFDRNVGKCARWNAVWDSIIEPIIFELITCICLYFISSIWLHNKAWIVVLAFALINVTSGLIFRTHKTKKQLQHKFYKLLMEETIFTCCFANKNTK